MFHPRYTAFDNLNNHCYTVKSCFVPHLLYSPLTPVEIMGKEDTRMRDLTNARKGVPTDDDRQADIARALAENRSLEGQRRLRQMQESSRMDIERRRSQAQRKNARENRYKPAPRRV